LKRKLLTPDPAAIGRPAGPAQPDAVGPAYLTGTRGAADRRPGRARVPGSGAAPGVGSGPLRLQRGREACGAHCS